MPRKLPVVLSRDEVSRLIASAGHLKYQTALSVAYGAGLRASEVVGLKVGDIDSTRMTLRVEQGKLLEGGWLFPGQQPINPLSTRQLNRAVHAAAAEAEIDKRVRCTPCATALPPICWSRRSTSA